MKTTQKEKTKPFVLRFYKNGRSYWCSGFTTLLSIAKELYDKRPGRVADLLKHAFVVAFSKMNLKDEQVYVKIYEFEASRHGYASIIKFKGYAIAYPSGESKEFKMVVKTRGTNAVRLSSLVVNGVQVEQGNSKHFKVKT